MDTGIGEPVAVTPGDTHPPSSLSVDLEILLGASLLPSGDDEADHDTAYWDASAMTAPNPTSLAAIGRLESYTPPVFPLWERLPARRRAAVLILLYPDRRGDLRVVITMRAAGLRSFPNQAALPGGKADSVEETPYQTARREAWEEIGLPASDAQIPPPFRTRHLCYLPHHLARTDVVVRPCVALLDVDPQAAAAAAAKSFPSAPIPLVEEMLVPRLNAKEVAAVFSAPFQDFLAAADRARADGRAPPPGCWYDGAWAVSRNRRWRLHNFYVPVDRQRVATAGGAAEVGAEAARKQRMGAGPDFQGEEEGDGTGDREEEEVQSRYKVWGMTAHVLVDAARIAYGRDPEQEHNVHFGDEAVIAEEAEGWEWLKGKASDEHKM